MRSLQSTWVLVACAACSTDTFTSPDAPTCDSSPFCANQKNTLFCADFDEGSLTAGWDVTAPEVAGSPTGALDTTDSTSCPASFVVDAPPLPAPAATFQHYRLVKTVPIALTSNIVVVAFDVKLPTVPPPEGGIFDDFDVISVRKSADATYNARLQHSSDGGWFLRMGTGGMTEATTTELYPMTNAWNHMVITLQLSAMGTGSASIVYTKSDGTTATSKTGSGTNTSDVTAPITVQAGITAYSATSEEWKVHFDGIVLTGS